MKFYRVEERPMGYDHSIGCVLCCKLQATELEFAICNLHQRRLRMSICDIKTILLKEMFS